MYMNDQTKTTFEDNYNNVKKHDKTINDYELQSRLHKGTYSQLYIARSKVDQKKCIIKVLDKTAVCKFKLLTQITIETRILQAIKFPFLLNSEAHFTDKCSIYFILPFAGGGDLFNILQKYHFLDENTSKFYAAQIFLALAYLHKFHLVHRDVKPENILLCLDGYIKLGDFGFCKKVTGRTYTLCGTPEYFAPEIIKTAGYGLSIDWWSFGVLTYELNCGSTPFKQTYQNLYENILQLRYKIPSTFSPQLSDLIKGLLQVDLSKRLGNLVNGVEDIRNHAWFGELKWSSILSKTYPAPILPTSVDIIQDKPIFTSENCDAESIKQYFQELSF